MRNLMIFATLMATAGSAVALSEGEYVAKSADCAACHTSPQGKDLTGGVRFATPLGDIYSTNITPDIQHGIGGYNFDAFNKAMREGIAKDGHALYPAMPYTSYVKMSDKDMRALYDYLMKEVEPQPVANRDNDISWPMSVRWPLHVWNSIFLENGEYKPQADQSAEWNRGAYLVQAAGHCGACHTPRGWAQQEKAVDQQNVAFLSGGELDGWSAPSLRGLKISQPELVTLLKTGRNTRDAVSGPMGEVITNSTQFMTDADLNSMAVYLLSLKAEVPQKPAKTAVATPAGQQTFMRYCSTCHGVNGDGKALAIPALAGNLTVNSENPQTLLRVILYGGQTPVTAEHMSNTMPGYGWTLTDQQAAELTNTLRASWGNQAAEVTPGDVAKARKAGK
ncbi:MULTISPECIES: cytochrome c [Rahnella]|uniref:Cytochrome c n=1 Tax=Rahnella laticis TaxID=2787622 RepID=A0ABS0E9Z0_9GAMM|nr:MULTISPECIES: cytochrome c [Rahnella]MBF7981841.1 cytochrome c [Rahnella laticis]MBF8001898.1 cytochrome c [Rahnella sp. LAC-M12]